MLLPKKREEWEEIKQEFIARGIEDTASSWTFIISQLQNTKMPELSFEYDHVINHYKRWKIAEVLQNEKVVYLNLLQDKLKAAIEALPNGSPSSDLPNEPHDLQATVQALPETQKPVVSGD